MLDYKKKQNKCFLNSEIDKKSSQESCRNRSTFYTHTHCSFDWVIETFLRQKVFPNKTSYKRLVKQVKARLVKQEAGLSHRSSFHHEMYWLFLQAHGREPCWSTEKWKYVCYTKADVKSRYLADLQRLGSQKKSQPKPLSTKATV